MTHNIIIGKKSVLSNALKKDIKNITILSANSTEIFKQVFKIFIIYISMTIIIFVMLKIINLRSYDAFNYSLSIISSGGFLPNNNFDKTFNNDFSKIILSLSMLLM